MVFITPPTTINRNELSLIAVSVKRKLSK